MFRCCCCRCRPWLSGTEREGQRRETESAKPGERKRTGLLLYGIFAAILVTVIILWLSLGGAERIGDFLVRRHYVEWADAYGFSVMDYLTHPIDTLKILANTAIEKGGYYITTLLGGLLGWIDITISRKSDAACCTAAHVVFGSHERG